MRNLLANGNRAFFLIVMVFFAFLAVQTPARACSCLEITPERSREIIDAAELIFEGSITAMEIRDQPEKNFDYTAQIPLDEHPFYAKASLKPAAFYKGSPQGPRIQAYIDIMTSCGYQFRTGDHALFILNKVENVLVQTDICSVPLSGDLQALREGK